MSSPPLDRGRLVRALREAADQTLEWPSAHDVRLYGELDGMRRAWRVVAAAIEDGEYDEAPPTEAELDARVRGLLDHLHGGRWER